MKFSHFFMEEFYGNEDARHLDGGHRLSWTSATSDEPPLCCQPLGALFTCVLENPITAQRKYFMSEPIPYLKIRGRNERDA